MSDGVKLTGSFCGLTREQVESIIADMVDKGYFMKIPILKRLWSAFDNFVTQFCVTLFYIRSRKENENKDPKKANQTQGR